MTAALNLWIGIRLPALIDSGLSGAVAVLERQIQAYPHRDKVRVLTLGNSHPQVALRVPLLASALQVSPDECFSLTFPAASAEEMRVLLRQYLPRFPNVRLAVIGLDPIFFGGRNDYRMRYLTRGSWPERWAYAMRFEKLEDRVQRVAAWWMPIMDFSPILRTQWDEKPTLTTQRLFADVQPPDEGITKTPYPWGYPLGWDNLDAEKLKRMKQAKQTARIVLHEADHQLGQIAMYAVGQADFESSLAMLEERRITTVTVEIPLERRMVARMRHAEHAPRYRAYQKILADLGAEGPVLRPAPDGWDRAWYMDTDHMTKAGSARLCQWLAARLPADARAALSSTSGPTGGRGGFTAGAEQKKPTE